MRSINDPQPSGRRVKGIYSTRKYHVNTIWSAKHLTTFWPPGTSTEVLCFHGGARRWITAFQQLQSDRESCLERSKSFNCR